MRFSWICLKYMLVFNILVQLGVSQWGFHWPVLWASEAEEEPNTAVRPSHKICWSVLGASLTLPPETKYWLLDLFGLFLSIITIHQYFFTYTMANCFLSRRAFGERITPLTLTCGKFLPNLPHDIHPTESTTQNSKQTLKHIIPYRHKIL